MKSLDLGWSVDFGDSGTVSLDPGKSLNFILTLVRENTNASSTMSFELYAVSTTDPSVFDSLTLKVGEDGVGDDDEGLPLPGFDAPVLIVGVGLGAMVFLLVLVGTEVGRYRFLLLLLPLYTRLKKKNVLDDFNRGRIMGYIETNPGVHYTDIMRSLGIGSGNLAYHLDVLEKQRFIVSRREGVYKLFYPRQQAANELLPPSSERFFSTGFSRKNFKPSDLEQKITSVIEEFQGISQVELAEHLGISKQSLGYHIKKLRRAGVITIKQEKGNTLCFINEKKVENLR